MVDVGRFIGRVLWVCRWCFPASIPCRVIVVHRLGVLWVFGGAFLLQSLAGGQWFIGSVASIGGRFIPLQGVRCNIVLMCYILRSLCKLKRGVVAAYVIPKTPLLGWLVFAVLGNMFSCAIPIKYGRNKTASVSAF